MRNYRKSGEYVSYPAAANAVSGAIVVVGQMFGVATHNALTGEWLTIRCGGIIELDKLNAASMSVGMGGNVYWDATNSKAVANVTGNTKIGVAVAAASNVAPKIMVRLNASF
jgi:predicted RecA/RadA family phage recombinase